MPKYLRKLGRSGRWLPGPGDFVDEKPAQKFPPTALRDFENDEGNVSVWLVDDELKNLDQILAAIATTRNSSGDVDYVLLEEATIKEELGLEVRVDQGETKDERANGWHRNIAIRSSGDLEGLADKIWRAPKTRRREGAVLNLLVDGIDEGRFREDQLAESLAKHVRECRSRRRTSRETDGQ